MRKGWRWWRFKTLLGFTQVPPWLVAIFADQVLLYYSELTRELLKWRLCGGHGTSRVYSWAAQRLTCRLYRVVNLHRPSSAKVCKRKVILTSESQIRKRDFTLRLGPVWLRSRIWVSAKCRIHQLLTTATFFIIRHADQWVWPSLKVTKATISFFFQMTGAGSSLAKL